MNIQIIVQEPPDRPSNIRVEQVGSRKITLFWSAPYSGNSPITRFILIYRSEGDHDHQNRKEMIIPASHTNVVVKNLLPATEYHFHLLAENAVGRSDLSEEITVTSDIEVPGGPPQDVRAEVLGSQLVRVTWKSPEPHLTHGPIKGYYVGYKVHGSSEAHTYKTMNANVKDEKLTCFLENLKKLTRYKIIVQAFNIKGAGPPSDEVLFVTLDNDPPTAPKLKMASVSFTSIQVTWTVQGSDNIPISGFILNHKRDTENWIKTRLPNDSRMYTFYGLHCGTPYQFFIIAFNDIGESFPSNTVQVKTRGAAPSSPTQHAFISVNVTSATLHFMEWDSGGCPVSYFVIQYKAEVSKDWIVVNERIFPQTLTYVIGGLIPATWYQLRVVAHNDAGSTRADYSFVTLPLSSQTSSTARSNSLHLYTNLVIIIPVIVSCIILAVVVVIVCSVTRRRQGRRDTRAVQKELTTESVPMSEVESKPTTDCVYSRPKSCLNYPSPYASNCIPFDHRHNLRSEDSRIERHSTVDSKRIYDVPFAMREPAHSSGLDYRERRNTPVHETSRKHSHDSNNATYSFPGILIFNRQSVVFNISVFKFCNVFGEPNLHLRTGRPTSQPMLRNYTTHLSHSWCNSDMDDNLTVNLPYEKTSFATRWHGSSKQGADIAQFYWNGYTSNPEIEDGYSYSTRIPDLTFHENDDEAEFDRDQVLDSCPGFLNKWGTPFHVAFSRQVLLYPIETDI
ncbi:cell adhesion molecule Dscam1-like isoform X2 [Tachypleus tridentatus]|uniref:cell adhesion molecule Dscam1-like isoform X2 n=1 Tax=Tachypleus tridentatus TaxID=6853 RepID=UPI003FD49C11